MPSAWLAEALAEVIRYFGAASFERQRIEGCWVFAGKLYRDILTRLTVDMVDSRKHRAWMKRFKNRWKKRLNQIELWMVSYDIHVE